MVGTLHLQSQTFETVNGLLQIKMQTYGIAVWQDSVLISDNNIRIFFFFFEKTVLKPLLQVTYKFVSFLILSINHGNAHNLSQ